MLHDWWVYANPLGRHLWPGTATAKIGDERPAADILKQIELTRSAIPAAGNVHWHIKSLIENLGAVSDKLTNDPYAQPAIMPAYPWLATVKPTPPSVSLVHERLEWSGSADMEGHRWAVQMKRGDEWTLKLLSGSERAITLDPDDLPDAIAITLLDRVGNASPATVIERTGIRDALVAGKRKPDPGQL